MNAFNIFRFLLLINVSSTVFCQRNRWYVENGDRRIRKQDTDGAPPGWEFRRERTKKALAQSPWEGRSHRAIAPHNCQIGSELGTCMFVWECLKTDGKHLGMCMDGFMFGSCCVHDSDANEIDIEEEKEEDRELDEDDDWTQVQGSVLSATTPVSTSATTLKYPTRPPRPAKPLKWPSNVPKRKEFPLKRNPSVYNKKNPEISKKKPEKSKKPPLKSSWVWGSNQETTSTTSTTERTSYFPTSSGLDSSEMTTEYGNNLESEAFDEDDDITFVSSSEEESPSAESEEAEVVTEWKTAVSSRPTRPTRPPKPNYFPDKNFPDKNFPDKKFSDKNSHKAEEKNDVVSFYPMKEDKISFPSDDQDKPISFGQESIVDTSYYSLSKITQRPTRPPKTRPTPTKKMRPTPTKKTETTTKTTAILVDTPYYSFSKNTQRPTRPPKTRPTPTKKTWPTTSKKTKPTTTTTKTTTTTVKTTTKKASIRAPSVTTPLTTKRPLPVKPVNPRSSSCGISQMKSNCPKGRIVNGTQSCYGQFPWQVSVRRTSFFGFTSTHRCGGALINEYWVATAGHCVDDLQTQKIRVRVGEWDFSTTSEKFSHIERKIVQKIVHPKYNFFTYENDLALLKVDQRINFQDNILPICLPGNDDLLVGEMGTVAGWGRLSEGGQLPNILQYVSVPIVSNEKCKGMFLRAGRQEVIPEIFMCAGYDTGGRDSCQGDSGGPLVVKGNDDRWFLGGIISWGIGCAEPNLPGVCTRISKFRDWILENAT